MEKKRCRGRQEGASTKRLQLKEIVRREKHIPPIDNSHGAPVNVYR